MRKIFLLCALFLGINSVLFATKDQIHDRYLGHVLRSVTLFNGDRHGDFKNDFVAILSDESSWKVHPKDRDIFSQWNVGDSIRMRVRTSFYWFKREHKFELVNDVKGQQTVRAMFIHYGDFPHIITGCQSKVVGYRMATHRTTDAHGRVHYHHYPVYIYKTVIQLNDGSQWISEGGCHFKHEEHAYIFVDQADGSFILLTGREREATWQKVILDPPTP